MVFNQLGDFFFLNKMHPPRVCGLTELFLCPLSGEPVWPSGKALGW